MNRKKLILSILVIVFMLTLVYSFMRRPKLQHVGTLKYRPGAVAVAIKPDTKESASKPLDDKKLHLDLLAKESPRFVGFQRNIFKPVFVDEQKPLPFRPSLPVVIPLPPPPPPPPPIQPVPPPVAEPDPFQLDMAKITFLGFLKKGSVKTVFLSKDKDIFVVKKGDTIAGKYVVTNITDDALTINSRSGGGEVIIPLVENKPLNSLRSAN